MKIVVFGATGKVGRLVVKELLGHGHHVIAFVYGESSLAETDHLKIFNGNVKNRDDIAKALQGSDAVVSALGSWGTKTKDILSSGMANIVPEMEEQGIKRIVSLTGSSAYVPGDAWGFAGKTMRWLLVSIAPKIIKDAELHIILLANSS